MVRLRVIFDANLYLNFLLSPDQDGTAVGFALQTASQGSFDLLLPDDVVAELDAVIVRKPYLNARISQENLHGLLRRLLDFATLLPTLEDEPPPVCRDPRDDYLIALAAIHAVDYIVTRDRDLLSLREIAGIRIIDPVTFLGLVRLQTNPS